MTRQTAIGCASPIMATVELKWETAKWNLKSIYKRPVLAIMPFQGEMLTHRQCFAF